MHKLDVFFRNNVTIYSIIVILSCQYHVTVAHGTFGQHSRHSTKKLIPHRGIIPLSC
jgi:hypothetical protein